MMVIGQAISVPLRRVTNADVLDEARHHSQKHLSESEMEKVLGSLSELFTKTGLESRSWRMGHERPIDLLKEAFFNALASSGVKPSDIDVVIYCSIHRGFWEPATASIACDALNLKPGRAFDVLDACMGWATALDICYSHFTAGRAKIAAVLSCEFPNGIGGAIYPECFTFRSERDVNFKSAGLTMGEAAAVTIVGAKPEDSWVLCRMEVPELSGLCRVPLYCHDLYDCNGQSSTSISKPGTFVAEITKLAAGGYRPSLEVLRRYVALAGRPDILIPHSISRSFPRRVARKVGLADRVFTTYPEFGNLATASLPVSLTTAISRGEISKDSHIAGWVASAGMKFSAFSISVSQQVIERASLRQQN